MNTWDDLGVHDDRHIQDRIQTAVVLMHNAAGKAVKAERVDFYVSRLKHLGSDPALWDVLEQAADKCECPSTAAIKDTVAKIKAQRKPPPEQYAPTEDERNRSRAAALKTALWLHYEHGWSWERFGKEMFESVLGAANLDSNAAFEAAKRKHSREQIAAWMEEQPR